MLPGVFLQLVLSRIAPDKWKHFYVGIALGVVLQAVVPEILPVHGWMAAIIVLVLLILISYGFELLSLIIRRGHHDLWDAVAGVAGGLIGMAIVYGIKFFA